MSETIVIRCRDNGPLVVRGPFQLVDNDNKPFTLPAGKEFVALCRCGNSKNKPYCDGTHNSTGFQACEKAPQ